jgi:hypothetical protein
MKTIEEFDEFAVKSWQETPTGRLGAAPAVLRPGSGTARTDIPTVMTLDELLQKSLPPLRWIVPGLIPEGVTLLAGRPKSGKSYLALQIAVALGEGAPVLGEIACEPCEVLYIALEDGERRLQGRALKLRGPRAKGVHIATKWPRIGSGAVEALDHWLDRLRPVKLVVVDTLARVQGDQGDKHKNAYRADYDTLAGFCDLAGRRGVGGHDRPPHPQRGQTGRRGQR